ncbi:zinc-binding dehydrogenase [Wenzhouxiangella sp. XN79A]|uniref:zinc-binding dehydrogenase n=1 Tax=Wenzhouxiangella sp. XN79A TaxID=2724193 RepID=UPI00144AA389|nr:zinc-binding dehydrogenase [Wenzhouxiangella sp. XN79A]NKI35618.1 zinc-binding dehydrogenase [Wenzhouxiangella sp. XN79A]
MHRILIDKPGGFDALRLIEEPDPVPGPCEVVIAVQAAGVNYADGIIRMGLYESAKTLHGYPITPGFEVAGTIAAVGDDVDGWSVGDEVIGLTLFNGYATRLKIRADGVFAKPRQLDMAEAATIPTVFLTADWMVHRQVHPEPGDTWLVHSAAGGVGSALVQLGRRAGVRVVGVVGRSHKVEYVNGMGAEAVIDAATDDLWSRAADLAPDGYHAIFDANGVKTLKQSYDHLAPTGKLVVYGFASMLPRNGRLNWLRLARDWLRTPRFNPMDMTKSNKSVMAANLSFLQSHAPMLRAHMLRLLEQFEQGALTPLPVETHRLADAAEAQRRIESGETLGKLALTCA